MTGGPEQDDFDEALDEGAVAFDAGPSDPVATARRRHGAAGAIVAAGMLGLDQMLGKKPKQDAPIVVAASSDPVDIDLNGISLVIEPGTSVVAPAQPRTDPVAARSSRGRSGRRKRN
jgi:hypothetical protein